LLLLNLEGLKGSNNSKVRVLGEAFKQALDFRLWEVGALNQPNKILDLDSKSNNLDLAVASLCKIKDKELQLGQVSSVIHK
jgi:hypothetical protein